MKSLKIKFALRILEKHSKALKNPLILPFTGFNTVFGDLYPYKIVVPLFCAAMQIKAPQVYTNIHKLISLVMDSR